MKVALTGFGYSSWNISASETKQAPVKRLGLKTREVKKIILVVLRQPLNHAYLKLGLSK